MMPIPSPDGIGAQFHTFAGLFEPDAYAKYFHKIPLGDGVTLWADGEGDPHYFVQRGDDWKAFAHAVYEGGTSVFWVIERELHEPLLLLNVHTHGLYNTAVLEVGLVSRGVPRNFPETGESYIDLPGISKTYRWDGNEHFVLQDLEEPPMNGYRSMQGGEEAFIWSQVTGEDLILTLQAASHCEQICFPITIDEEWLETILLLHKSLRDKTMPYLQWGRQLGIGYSLP